MDRKEVDREVAREEVTGVRKDRDEVTEVQKECADVPKLAESLSLKAVCICPDGWVVYDQNGQYLGLVSFSRRVGCYKVTSGFLEGSTYGQLPHLLGLLARIRRSP
jgi:hypothetical protein